MVLSIDIGTTFLKAAVVDFNGHIHFSSRKRIQIYTDSDTAEVQPEDWITGLIEICSSVSYDVASGITVIVVSGNGPTVIPVDDNGSPVHRGVLWMDKRSEAISHDMSSAIGDFNPNFFLGKSFWFKKHMPELYGKVSSFMSCPEYISYKLTGNRYTLLPGDGFIPFYWTEEKILKLGMDYDKFPQFISPTEVYGVFNSCLKLGNISQGIPVVCGGPDFLMSVLGSGSIKAGILCDRTGTSEGLNLCTDYRVDRDNLRTLPHLVDSLYTIAGLIPDSGELVIKGRLNEVVEKYKKIIDLMITSGLQIDEIRIIGGHSQIAELNRMKAEAFTIPVKVYPSGSDLVGNAVLGSVVTGVYGSFEEAENNMVREIKCYNV